MCTPVELTTHTWDIDIPALNMQIDGMWQHRHGGGRNSSAYWNSFRGMEELLEDREQDELERNAADQEREGRQQEHQVTALQARQQSKAMDDKLVQMVMADEGRISQWEGIPKFVCTKTNPSR